MHVETFERLVRAEDASIKVEHVVAEELLADARRVGPDEPALVARVQTAMRDAAATGAAIVVCTCSTIGGAAEHTPTGGRFVAARIDRAMADRAVALGPRILLVAALESTLGPTTQLLHESARAAGATIVPQRLLVADAWALFLRGDLAGYVETVAAAVRAAASRMDVVLLAQASMAPVAERLADLGVEVLASPRLGVRQAVARIGG